MRATNRDRERERGGEIVLAILDADDGLPIENSIEVSQDVM